MLYVFNQFEPIVVVTKQLLQQLNCKVNYSTINNTLRNHPDYPSIISIADSLKKWHIDNVILKTVPEKLVDLPTPFIAHTNKEGFVTVVQVDNNTVVYLNSNGGGVKK